MTTSQKINYKIIRNHWQRFNNELQNRKLIQGKGWEKYGITQKIDNKYFYLTAIPLNTKITEFETVEIKEGKFACFQHMGNIELIKTTIYDIYKRIIPKFDLKVDNKRIMLHYEYYNYRFHWDKNDSIINIYLPIES